MHRGLTYEGLHDAKHLIVHDEPFAHNFHGFGLRPLMGFFFGLYGGCCFVYDNTDNGQYGDDDQAYNHLIHPLCEPHGEADGIGVEQHFVAVAASWSNHLEMALEGR